MNIGDVVKLEKEYENNFVPTDGYLWVITKPCPTGRDRAWTCKSIATGKEISFWEHTLVKPSAVHPHTET